MTTNAGENAVPSGRTDIASWLNLAVAIAFLNVGNLWIDSVAKGSDVSLDLFLSLGFIGALGCLGAAFFFYVRALARLPLAVAYPIMVGLSMVIVAVADLWWFHRPLTTPQIIGVLAIFLGVTLITAANRKP